MTAEQEKALKEARDRYAAFHAYTSDMPDMVDFYAQQIREKLKLAGQGAAALGHPTDAAGEAEIEARRIACALRSARKMYGEFLSETSALEIDNLGFRRRQLEAMVKSAGAGLAALDANANSSDRDVADRLDGAQKAILRVTARKLFREFTEGNTASFADHLDYQRKKVEQHVEAAGFGWADLDPAGGSDDAAKEKLEQGARRACLLNARKTYDEFRLTPSAWGEHMIQYHVKKIKGMLEKAGVDAAALDASGAATAAEMERRIEGVAERARFVDLLRPFEESKTTPATLKELWGKLGPLRLQFDRAKEYFDAADPALAPLAKRFEEASRKARDHACEQEGVVPVLKTLRFGQKTSGTT